MAAAVPQWIFCDTETVTGAVFYYNPYLKELAHGCQILEKSLE
jgi:hypothetical protein